MPYRSEYDQSEIPMTIGPPRRALRAGRKITTTLALSFDVPVRRRGRAYAAIFQSCSTVVRCQRASARRPWYLFGVIDEPRQWC